MDSKDISLGKLTFQTDSCLAYLTLEKGLSDNSIVSYQNDLEQFASFCVKKLKRSNWLQVNSFDVSDWLYDLSEAGLSNSTLCRKLSALRTFDTFLLRERVTVKSFMDLVSGPRLQRKAPEVLSISEMEKLLAVPDSSSPLDLRDRAILELLYSSGLRVSELCSLPLQMVDLEHGALKVLGKGSKERVVPIGGKALMSLKNYIDKGRPSIVKSNTGSALFISRRGAPISRKTIWLMVVNAGKAACIEKPVKPHALRHSFATHLLSGGADLRVIQELLGHADIATTQIYAAVDAARVVSAHEEHHPRSQGDADIL
ncbi:site-specific tyrosine recombinase XerD [Puniceicoccaceae bacterium K14]|nr:site-specific tyrosine recombinase XerD [Puniceicoccaceae bacterium K14]